MAEKLFYYTPDELIFQLNQAIEQWASGQIVPLPNWYQ